MTKTGDIIYKSRFQCYIITTLAGGPLTKIFETLPLNNVTEKNKKEVYLIRLCIYVIMTESVGKNDLFGTHRYKI